MKAHFYALVIGLSLTLNGQALAEKFDSFQAHQVEVGDPGHSGEKLYNTLCASCHHEKRIGLSGPPLLPEFLRRKTPQQIEKIILEGLPSTLMPAFPQLDKKQTSALIAYMHHPGDYQWSEKDIIHSLTSIQREAKKLNFKSIRNITPVVERDANKVWVMENEKVLDKFTVNNVHGGIKYTTSGNDFFVPSRDGWVTKYSLQQGKPTNKVRACVYLRNISVSRDNRYLFATCRLPQQLVTFNASDLTLVDTQPLEGKISALYELYSDDKAIFTYRDRALLGILDTKTRKINYETLDAPIEDFFIDPFDRYLIGTSRRGTQLQIYDLQTNKVVFEQKIEGMPHLFSATYWYQDGNFYFATPHMNKPYITVWKMYDWKFIKKVNIGGDGFFVKTHPATPWLWIDNGSDELVLINKKDFSEKRIKPVPGKKFNHTEFSGDGRYTYLSIYENDGALLVYNTDTFEELKNYPANMPIGKYNFVNKNRVFYREQFGMSIFVEKCWGCHHQTAQAFGPSFQEIADKRNNGEIIGHISDPASSAKRLGYSRSLMPDFKLDQQELLSIVEYINHFKSKPTAH